MARSRHPRGLVLPALAVALLARLAAGDQLYGVELAGIRQSAGSLTATYSNAPGSTTGLPTGVNGVGINPTTGVIYLATVAHVGGMASTVIAATPSGGSYTLTTIAGNYGSSATSDGVGAAANFMQLQSVAVDGSGNVYMTDVAGGKVRMLTPSGGSYVATTITTVPSLSLGTGLGTTPGNALAVTTAGVVYVVDTTGGAVWELVNSGGTWSRTRIANSDLFFPQGIAVDSVTGTVYVVDTYNKRIRQLVKSGASWTATTIAGSAAPCCADGAWKCLFVPASWRLWAHSERPVPIAGPGSSASFNLPVDAAWDASTSSLYVTDRDGKQIRKLTNPGGSGWVVSTVNDGNANSCSGSPLTAVSPVGIAVDNAGLLYVYDKSCYTIKRMGPPPPPSPPSPPSPPPLPPSPSPPSPPPAPGSGSSSVPVASAYSVAPRANMSAAAASARGIGAPSSASGAT